MNILIATLITTFSVINNIDPKLTTAVIQTESKFDQNATGKLGEQGLMQIRPELAPTVNLYNPIINIAVGTWMLSQAKKKCKHKVAKTFVVCYNAGIAGGSRLIRPLEFEYYKRVNLAYGRN